MKKPAKHFYEFVPFRLDAGERILLREGERVPLSPKPCDILLVLVQNCGHLVEKSAISPATSRLCAKRLTIMGMCIVSSRPYRVEAIAS
jgi:DNA-binding response OmpR family regulator